MEPLTSVDAAWLGMEDPTNLMMVSGILTLERPVDFDKLKHVLETRLLQHQRFRQCVIQSARPMSPPYWQDDPNFDINSHVHRVALPAPGDQNTLQEMVSDIMSRPLDFSKPLWDMIVIEGYEDGCAIMSRLHHCIADGMALVMVLLSMTDFTPDAPQLDNRPPDKEESAGHRGPIGSIFKQASTAVSTMRKMTRRAISEGFETLTNPTHAIELALKGSDSALAAGRLVLRPPDPQTIFKGQLGVAKRAAWSKPIPLKDVKAIKNALGGTVNDVLVSAMTGSLRRYLVGRGEDVEDLNFRSVIPVNLRRQDEMQELGNKFGLVFLSMPIGIADPLDRLLEVRQRMDELKGSQEAVAAFGILKGIGMTPRDVQEEVVKMFGTKATAVLTNVPGPPMPLYFAGTKITGLMFWVPQSGRVSLGLSILSYAGKVFVGVATDAGLVPDPDTILTHLYTEFDQLKELARETEELAQQKTKPATAPVETAVSATTATAPEAEDLTAVKGIGPKFAERLHAAGIQTVAQLLSTPASNLANTLAVSESRATAILEAAQTGM
ncbi:MAG: wax ester/triacylglycerol synthase family O-acyltransferase [Anaerolineales bacterium]|nr:wax ester/triacylglycerol synthase family O-acyltransferase [Anaerolineales bacterium]